MMDDEDKEEMTRLYKTKNEFLKKRAETAKKVFTKEPDALAKIRAINLDINLTKYKYKEIVPTVITDKYYILEEEYKKRGIPYSPFLISDPMISTENNKNNQKDDFDYYKRHILLENYDEEIELPEQMKALMEQYKEQDGSINACTKWFDPTGKQFWKKCNVIQFNEDESNFTIQVQKLDGGMITKKVTRFNLLFDKEKKERLDLRMKLAEKWKNLANKFLAFYHFVSSCTIKNIPVLFNDQYKKRIFYLVFVYYF